MAYRRPGRRRRRHKKYRQSQAAKSRRIRNSPAAWHGDGMDLQSDGNYPDFTPPEYDGCDDGFGRPYYGEVV